MSVGGRRAREEHPPREGRRDADQRRLLRLPPARSSTGWRTARSWSRSPSSGWPRPGSSLAYPHDGFWACMDTFKDKQLLDDLYTRGQRALGGLEAQNAAQPRPTEGPVQRVSRPRGRSGSDAGPRPRAPTATTSRSAAAGRSSAWSPSAATWRSSGSSSAPRPSARRGARLGRRVPRGVPRRSGRSSRDHRDGFLPYAGARGEGRVRGAEERVLARISCFTHYRDDRHQDHRLVSELTWNTWRDHLILEYEIPKYDGDFGSPNLFASSPRDVVERKIDLLLKHFPSQAGKAWFTADLFRAVAAPRDGVAPDRLAEAFYCRKLMV